MRTFYLGDIHGNFGLINQFVKRFDIKNAYIIQVGDFGVGFTELEKEKTLLELVNEVMVERNIQLLAIRGNHDYPKYFENDPFGLSNIKLLPDYTVMDIEGENHLFIGGAVSVDREWRKTKLQRNGDFITKLGNESWWPDETFNLDKGKLETIRDIDVVVTHTTIIDCFPDNRAGFGPFIENIVLGTGDDKLKGDLLIERNKMSECFDILKKNNNIKFHYYGHFHDEKFLEFEGIKHRLLGVGQFWEENNL